MPVVRTQEDEDRVRNNPRITMDEATAVAQFSDNIARRRGAGAAPARDVIYGNESLDGVAGAGRLDATTSTSRPSTPSAAGSSARSRSIATGRSPCIGWDVADKLFGPLDPIDKVITIGGLHFRVVGVSEKKGSVFGNSQDEFAIIPLGVFQKMFGSRMFGMQLLVKPQTPDLVKAAMDDATVALRDRAAAAAEGPRQLRDVHVRHAARHLRHGHQRASSRCSSASSRCRSSSAASSS